MSNTDNQHISDAYKKIATEQPPSELDSIILSAAHAEVPKKSNVISFTLIPASWIVPLTVAATVVLSIGIVLTIPDSKFQKTSEHDYVMPESIEEQKRNNLAEAETTGAAESELRKEIKSKSGSLDKTIIKQEKTVAERSLKSTDRKQAPAEISSKDSLLKKNEPNQKPAMSSRPARSSSMKLDRDVSANLESASTASPAVKSPASGSLAIAPQKSAPKLARKKARKKIGLKEFLVNIKKVAIGNNKRKVYELLSTPLLQKNEYWQYQYIVAGVEKNYFIRFKNNLVIKIEQPE